MNKNISPFITENIMIDFGSHLIHKCVFIVKLLSGQ